MRSGYQIYDADTHVGPSVETLVRYLDSGLRSRLVELEPYKVQITAVEREGCPRGRHFYHVGERNFSRPLGAAEAEAKPTWGRRQARRPISEGVGDDNVKNRMLDMDAEGVDRAFLVSGTTLASIAAFPDLELRMECLAAFHRYLDDFCGRAGGRLTSAVVVHPEMIEGSIAEIRRWGKEPWAVAVLPLVGREHPLDHPRLEPVWALAAEYNLAIVHHCFTWFPPFFPSYEDQWDNIFLARLASHPYSAMRFMAAIIGSGILDRYPNLRAACLESGCGWLPFWAQRMDEQAEYVGGTIGLKQRCSDYIRSGRVLTTVQLSEGPEITRAVIDLLGGDDMLLYGSDFPHGECMFPDSPDIVLGWASRLPEGTMPKLMAGNAARLYRK